MNQNEQSREEQFWAIFSEGGVTPIEINPNDSTSVEHGAKQIVDRISKFVSEKSKDKPKT